MRGQKRKNRRRWEYEEEEDEKMAGEEKGQKTGEERKK